MDLIMVHGHGLDHGTDHGSLNLSPTPTAHGHGSRSDHTVGLSEEGSFESSFTQFILLRRRSLRRFHRRARRSVVIYRPALQRRLVGVAFCPHPPCTLLAALRAPPFGSGLASPSPSPSSTSNSSSFVSAAPTVTRAASSPLSCSHSNRRISPLLSSSSSSSSSSPTARPLAPSGVFFSRNRVAPSGAPS